MKTFLQDLIFSNYRLVKSRYNSNKINPKTGISDGERKRVLSPENIENNFTRLFEEKFHYTSGSALLHSLDEIFLQDIYKFTTSTDKPYIVDCGANMGLSILYFKRQYPNAEIDAFEPDKNIFSVLKKNMEAFYKDGSVRIHEKAVWKDETELDFFSDGGLSGSTVLDFSHTETTSKVKTVDLKKFLKRNVDFLKIDIEGAENDLIFDLKGNLDNVKHFFLEYHGIKDSPQNLGDILNLLKSEGFEYCIRVAGETINYPFCGDRPKNYNQQLNILCYRK